MKRFSARVLLLFSGAIFVLFLCSPDIVQRTAYESVLFCSSVLIPSLFPGFVLSDLIISLSAGLQGGTDGIFFKIFRLPSACVRCWIIGLLAGFPSAADCSSQLVRSGMISRTDGERCLAFTNNPGIVFVVCAVGSGLFGSYSVGVYLWTIQTVTAVLIGVLMATPRRMNPSKGVASSPEAFHRAFPKAVVSSVSSVLNICGFVVFFRVLISVLTSAVPLDRTKTILSGLLEITCGISFLKDFSLFSAVLASVMLGWSGFSVHFQILNVISSAGLSARYYFPGKVLQALLSTGITVVTYPIFFHSSSQVSPIGVCLLAFLILTVLIIRFRKEYHYGKQRV